MTIWPIYQSQVSDLTLATFSSSSWSWGFYFSFMLCSLGRQGGSSDGKEEGPLSTPANARRVNAEIN